MGIFRNILKWFFDLVIQVTHLDLGGDTLILYLKAAHIQTRDLDIVIWSEGK